MSGVWIQRPAMGERPAARVICFPYAGVGASVYRNWAQGLAAGIEVCAVEWTGRGARLREPPLQDIGAIVSGLLPHLRALLDVPAVFFGHSMGAVLAYETTLRLRTERAPLPLHLFVSARRPPSLPDTAPPLRHLSDENFITEINQRFGGIPRQILEDPEVLALLLPALRADVAALETHRPPAREPLSTPITVFGGTDDWITPRSHLEAWRSETTAAMKLRLLAGGHFFLEQRRPEILAEIASVLTPALSSVSDVSTA